MLISNLDLLATAPGGVARLRELILTLAVQGKLVPQDPDDEPASELLKKIRGEKERLISEGKIKRDKTLTEIAEDEAPYGLPIGWEWVRFGAVGVVASSSRVRQSDWRSSGVPFYRAREIVKLSKDGHVNNDLFISEELFDSLTHGGSVPKENDIMITGVGTIGIPYVVKQADRFYFKDASVLIFKNYGQLNAQYLSLMMRSPLWVEGIHEFSMGTTVDTLTIERANIAILPLPPANEQSRIVTRVEELMRLCDALEAKGQLEATQHAQLVSTLLGTLTESETPEELAENWHRIATHFDLLLDRPEAVDALEQTILQLAVRGLLVPQDPQDEPASELLKRIRAEKDKLIADGKIKRDKPLPPIAEEENPFNLPTGWEWVRVGNIGVTQTGGTPASSKPEYFDGNFPFIGPGQITLAGNILPPEKFISDLGRLESAVAEMGDILMVCIGGSIGKCASASYTTAFNQQINCIHPILASNEYVLNAMTAREFAAAVLSTATGSATPIISKGKWDLLLLPVPPLAEQSRIVIRVAQLRRLCNELRHRLVAASERQSQLTQSLVEKQCA